MQSNSDVIVVGGGAAGLFCAATAAQRGRRVLLVERMERPGRKLLITGKGRCNLTNNCDRDGFLGAVRSNSRFLYSAYNALSPQELMELFQGRLGVPLKTERGGRVFPRSDRSADIVDALVRYVRESGAALSRGRCTQLILEDGAAAGICLETGEKLWAESVVVATGGKSYPLTGSTGDGYELARQAGHTLISMRPSLIPVVVREDWCRDLMGLSLKNVTLRVMAGSKAVYSELGEMLFTHFGVSGPLVLSASAHMTGDLGQYRMEIDLKPGLSHQELEARILRDFADNRNRDFRNSLGALLPRKLIPVAVRLSGIPDGQKIHQVTKEQRRGFVALLKGMPLTPGGFRPIEEAVVTAGGVKVAEIRPGTMESKLASGLFFAGEILDVDAYTGGYNLQIAFSTGYLAGLHA